MKVIIPAAHDIDKMETSIDWPYFVIDFGLRAPQAEWVDTTKEILLQHKR
ncbi:hypothetical protein HYX11_01855 [Candidatus Woesearchaeota archaeon]|nr:hypothetical protein [Candidatus Woesearchaeota archaeon]